MKQDNTASTHTINTVATDKATMQVCGEALMCFPVFILQKFGKVKYQHWLKSLPTASREIFSKPLNKKAWYPIQEGLTDPTIATCDMFFNKSVRGAWECGRYSADYGLRGIKKILVKLSSPELLIQKATTIIQDYYRPCDLSIVSKEENHIVLRITLFPDINSYIEHRIAGWMERALQICGCKHVSINITYSLAKNQPYTEYSITWKKF